jgi:GTPase SAR1 family protein
MLARGMRALRRGARGDSLGSGFLLSTQQLPDSSSVGEHGDATSSSITLEPLDELPQLPDTSGGSDTTAIIADSDDITLDLPDEVLERILAQLDAGELCTQAAPACRRWREVATRDAVWCVVCLRSYPAAFPRLPRNLGAWCPHSDPVDVPPQWAGRGWKDIYRDELTLRFDDTSATAEEMRRARPVKLLLLGDARIGKSAFLQRFVYERPPAADKKYLSTIGIDFAMKKVRLRGTAMRLQVWDTAGEERYRSITRAHCRGTQAICLCFDVGSRSSFDSISTFHLPDLAQGYLLPRDPKCDLSSPVSLLLVGLKADASAADRQVSEEEGRALAATIAASFSPGRVSVAGYVECSSVTGAGVERAMCKIARDYVGNHPDAVSAMQPVNPAAAGESEGWLCRCCRRPRAARSC